LNLEAFFMPANNHLIDAVAHALPSESDVQREIGKKLRELAALRRLKRLAHELAEARQPKDRQAATPSQECKQ
jgi:predicted naringenin-chalcone synthase